MEIINQAEEGIDGRPCCRCQTMVQNVDPGPCPRKKKKMFQRFENATLVQVATGQSRESLMFYHIGLSSSRACPEGGPPCLPTYLVPTYLP